MRPLNGWAGPRHGLGPESSNQAESGPVLCEEGSWAWAWSNLSCHIMDEFSLNAQPYLGLKLQCCPGLGRIFTAMSGVKMLNVLLFTGPCLKPTRVYRLEMKENIRKVHN